MYFLFIYFILCQISVRKQHEVTCGVIRFATLTQTFHCAQNHNIESWR